MFRNKDKTRKIVFWILISISLEWALLCMLIGVDEGYPVWWRFGFIPYGFIPIALGVGLYLPRIGDWIKSQGRSIQNIRKMRYPMFWNEKFVKNALLNFLLYFLFSIAILIAGLFLVDASEEHGGTVIVGGLPIALILFVGAFMALIKGLVSLYFALIQISKYTIWKFAHRR